MKHADQRGAVLVATSVAPSSSRAAGSPSKTASESARPLTIEPDVSGWRSEGTEVEACFTVQCVPPSGPLETRAVAWLGSTRSKTGCLRGHRGGGPSGSARRRRWPRSCHRRHDSHLSAWRSCSSNLCGPDSRRSSHSPRLRRVTQCQVCGHENPETNKFCVRVRRTPRRRPNARSEVRKTVTIVFCDVVGSTAMGEALDPESLRHVMERYFDAMQAAIERHGGTVEKFIGDAVMAVFGVPQVHEDDALRAVRAAAEMRAALATLNDGARSRPRDHARLPDRGEHRRGRGRCGRPDDRDRRRRERRGTAGAGRFARRDPARGRDVRARPRCGHRRSGSMPWTLKGKTDPVPGVPPHRGHGRGGRVRPAPRRPDGGPGTGARAPPERVRADGDATRRVSSSRSSASGASGKSRLMAAFVRRARRARDGPPRPLPARTGRASRSTRSPRR